MESFWCSILTGIIGGLLTSLVLFLATILIRDYLAPWIEDKIYKGIRIDGRWSLVDSSGDDGESLYSQEETLELDQKAARVTGQLILVPKNDVVGKTRTLTIEGSIRDRFVMLTCSPSSRDHLGYQAFLGEITGDGACLKGQASYYHTEEEQVTSIEATYNRDH